MLALPVFICGARAPITRFRMSTMHTLPAPGSLLRLRHVLQLVPVSKSTWWAGVASGRFPQGIKLSERVTCWRSEDIARLIEDAAQRGAGAKEAA